MGVCHCLAQACHKKWKDDWAAEEQAKFARKHQMSSARAVRDAEAMKKALEKALRELEELKSRRTVKSSKETNQD